MPGGGTQAMSGIVEERQQRRRPLAATPLSREAGQARWLCCSLLTHRVCSSLAPCQRAPALRDSKVQMLFCGAPLVGSIAVSL